MKNEMKGIVVSWELEDIIPWKIDKAHAFLPFFVIVRNLLSIISSVMITIDSCRVEGV